MKSRSMKSRSTRSRTPTPKPLHLDRFRSALDLRYSELAHGVERLERSVTTLQGAESAQPPGEDSVVHDLQDHDFDILEHQDRAIAEVWRAFDRMSDGTYGLCESCGEAIAPERLEILPETTRCRLCQR
jgi:DnaK suppressor protein